MREDRKDRLHTLLKTRREAQFEQMWHAPASDYTRPREITEFILARGDRHGELLPLPRTELADLIKQLSKAFYLGKQSEKLGKGKSLVESYLIDHGHDLASFHDWCKESGVTSDGQFLGLLLDAWGVLKDRYRAPATSSEGQ